MSEDQKIIINTYGSQDAPDLAKFGVGGSTIADVREATEARNKLSDQQSTTTRGPVRRED